MRFNSVVTTFSSILFALGWWALIIAMAYADKVGGQKTPFVLVLGGILGTIGFFLINNLPSDIISSPWGQEDMSCFQKTIFVTSMVLILGAVIESAWVAFGTSWIMNNDYHKITGICSVAQTVLIAVSALLWRFVSKDESL